MCAASANPAPYAASPSEAPAASAAPARSTSARAVRDASVSGGACRRYRRTRRTPEWCPGGGATGSPERRQSARHGALRVSEGGALCRQHGTKPVRVRTAEEIDGTATTAGEQTVPGVALGLDEDDEGARAPRVHRMRRVRSGDERTSAVGVPACARGDRQLRVEPDDEMPAVVRVQASRAAGPPCDEDGGPRAQDAGRMRPRGRSWVAA